MATFIGEGYRGTHDLIALNGTEGTATGTSVDYIDPSLPGVIVTLTGTGITGTPSAAWNITGISETFHGHSAWTLTGLTGVDGAPTGGAFDPASIFQSLAFHTTFHLLFDSDSTLLGWPNGGTLFGGSGNDTMIARGGNLLMDGGGGFDTLIGAKHGHDVFRFDSKLDSSVNLDTIHGFSPVRDSIELSQVTFWSIDHFGPLSAAEFHVGSQATTTAQRIIYNQHNGDLYFDADGSGHHYSPVLFAQLVGHPALTASDFLLV